MGVLTPVVKSREVNTPVGNCPSILLKYSQGGCLSKKVTPPFLVILGDGHPGGEGGFKHHDKEITPLVLSKITHT